MIAFFKKPGRWAALYSLLLSAALLFVLLDTFLIPKSYAQTGAAATPAAQANPQPEASASRGSTSATEPVVTASSYSDENIQISVETLRAHGTTLYVADIQISDASLLKTALAGGVYGRNIKQATSEMAEEAGAVFAINGDYYGFRDEGFVIRNGTLYRGSSRGVEALIIDQEGNFSIVDEATADAGALLAQGAWQAFSFGPALVQNGVVAVEEGEEVSRSKSSNPRTAIGQVGPLHYIAIVSDGRTDESAGLSLFQLATELAARGAQTAYNLDGGGSSTMVLNGAVLNTTTSGRSDSERAVSDIVYIGY